MNHSRVIIGCALALAVAALPLTISARRLASAQERARLAQVALVKTANEAQEIVDLRAMRETVQAKPRPQQDVIAQVNASLAEVGISDRALSSLTPQSDSAVTVTTQGSAAAPTGLRQQTLQLELVDLAPEQLGAWLLQWRTAQGIWTPVRLDIVHSREQSGQDSNRYNATIVLSAMYLDDGHATKEGP